MVPMESRDSEGVPFASLDSGESVTKAFGRYRHQKGAEKWSRDITKIENLHIGKRRKIYWFQKCYSFRSMKKNNDVIAEKPFPNSGVFVDAWPSWIDARRQYMFLVIIIFCPQAQSRGREN